MSTAETNIQLEVMPNITAHPAQARELAMLYLTATGEPTSDEDIEHKLTDMTGETVIAALDNGGHFIAMAGLKRMVDVSEGVVQDVATDINHRREGLGTQLLSELSALAKEQGLTHLHVYPGPGSRQFYQKLGFSHQSGKSFNPSWGTKDL